jgi:ubiquinone/menaquinone biosynthesis C-methylase UbiE
VDENYPPGTFDVVVCRQGIGYLDIHTVFPAISRILRPGGQFIFNSFDRPKRFGFKGYQYEGATYNEVHLYLFGHVFHLQFREKMKPDVSVFRYYSPKTILENLMPFFTWKVIRKGNSIYWFCTPSRKGL